MTLFLQTENEDNLIFGLESNKNCDAAMMPWIYSTSCPLTEYILVVTKERQICLPQSTPSQPPNPPTPPCIALRRPPLGVTLATALNAHSTLRTCVQKSPPNFRGRWWDKNLVTPETGPFVHVRFEFAPTAGTTAGSPISRDEGVSHYFWDRKGERGGSMQIVVESMRGRVTPTGDAEIYGGTTTIMFSLLVFAFVLL